MAIQRDDSQTITALLTRGFDVNTPNEQGLTGLYVAVLEPSFKATQALIHWPGANLNTVNRQGETVLMMAAIKGYVDVVQALVDQGAQVNQMGWTALHYAASGGKTEVMRILLENYAYVDAESPNASTPLMMAAQYGTPEAVKLLLEAGADPTLSNQQGLTAMDFTKRAKGTLGAQSADLIASFLRARPSDTP